MSKPMPQEIEVWYLLPALRRELAKIFISEFHLSQKESANVLGITESAISQYLAEKRGHELQFTDEELHRIKEFATLILNDRENLTKHMYNLSVMFRGSQTICNIHRQNDGSLPENCDICMEES